MPTDSNESPTSITVVVPAMSTLTTNTTTTVTTSVSNNRSSSSSPTLPRSNSPLQSSTKQLHKLKRFLSTLYHFGSDISNEIGERVRALILALVVSLIFFRDSDTSLPGFKSSENESRCLFFSRTR
jgi:hypothetical protein